MIVLVLLQPERGDGSRGDCMATSSFSLIFTSEIMTPQEGASA